jgi:hypothetical protein
VNDDTIQPAPADDRAILAVLTALELQPWEEGFLATGPAGLGESAETLTRLYTEALGLLPWELATPPPPPLKERLMAIAMGDETQEVEAPALPAEPVSPPPVPPGPAQAGRRPSSGSFPRPVATPVPAAAGPSIPAAPPVVPQAARRPRSSRWPLALAAMLFLALGLSGFLLYGLWQQGEKIDDLTRDRNALIERTRSTSKSLEDVKAEMADLKARAALMTSPGVEIMPLRPTGQVPMPQGTYGMLFVAADHQHWHLAVHGLPAAAAGRQYQLWFINPQGAVSGGAFSAAPGTPVSLSSEHMPSDTQAVTVTLEPAATPAAAPTGPEVMRAGAAVKVL